MPRLKFTEQELQECLALLEETIARIAALTGGLTDAQLATPPGKKEWSVVEILAHVRGCNDVWTHSIYAMLSEYNPILADIDERRWAKATRYATLGFQQSFAAFSLSHAELLRVLHDLPEAAWERTCDIGGRKHSVFSQVRRMALHEQKHWAQIEATLQRLEAQGWQTS
jgi:hypothetical protein